jgi:hypothetical protein
MNRSDFKDPPRKYRVYPMQHGWPENREAFMGALRDYGFGGVVTNVPFENGFTSNPENIAEFNKIIGELEENGLSYWIYDENGYPSGYAGGEALKGHPELEAKGFYMRRRVAYEPRHTSFHIDEETDKIVWAAKYPLLIGRIDDGYPIYDNMEPVSFTDDFCECDLNEREVFYVFCVKPAYEGSHCTHNVCSFSRYINVMEPKAVERFIDLCFEPIAAAIPDAYAKAEAVFTDEPSLQVGYARSYESWPYALAPWKEGLFEDFIGEYGFDLRKYLPLIFEGGREAWPVRVKFYSLVGKLIARTYSGKLQRWCADHGGTFSGHYLGEESMVSHVRDYGSNLEVMRAAGYPGIDVLDCVPERYNYNTAKHAQMAARKNKTNGLMAEICPFGGMDEFKKAPVENMTGVMGLLYLAGVRHTNSYFSADYSGYAPEFSHLRGDMEREQARQFNAYVGRLGCMLDNLQNVCGVFVYYGLEDVQAKMRPQCSAFSGPEGEADRSAAALTRAIYEAGYDFYYADREDVVSAAKTGEISGNTVKVLIVPALDMIADDAYEALKALSERGAKVLFLDKIPAFGTEIGRTQKRGHFKPCGIAEVFAALKENEPELRVLSDAMILKAKFLRGREEIWFAVNNTRADAAVRFTHRKYSRGELWDPETGAVTPADLTGEFVIRAFRGIFLLFRQA